MIPLHDDDDDGALTLKHDNVNEDIVLYSYY